MSHHQANYLQREDANHFVVGSHQIKEGINASNSDEEIEKT